MQLSAVEAVLERFPDLIPSPYDRLNVKNLLFGYFTLYGEICVSAFSDKVDIHALNQVVERLDASQLVLAKVYKQSSDLVGAFVNGMDYINVTMDWAHEEVTTLMNSEPRDGLRLRKESFSPRHLIGKVQDALEEVIQTTAHETFRLKWREGEAINFPYLRVMDACCLEVEKTIKADIKAIYANVESVRGSISQAFDEELIKDAYRTYKTKQFVVELHARPSDLLDCEKFTQLSYKEILSKILDQGYVCKKLQLKIFDRDTGKVLGRSRVRVAFLAKGESPSKALYRSFMSCAMKDLNANHR